MPGRKLTPKKDSGRNSEERIIHEFHIISEGLISQIKQVAEGVANVDEKLDRTRLELKAEIEEKTQPIAQAVVSLNGRVGRLEEKADRLDGEVNSLDEKMGRLDGQVKSLAETAGRTDGKVNSLDEKMGRLDGKVEQIRQELKSEIQETKQEILAAVKFSYAELDKRLTTLEKEFLELKHRVEEIEGRSLS